MANVDGSWTTVTKTPMGDQEATLTVKSDGGTFTGGFVGTMGSVDVKDGKVSGDTLTWTMDITVPMPLTLSCEATVSDDSISGTVTAGAFGSFPLSGSRA